ncbi:MAG: phage terminase large subunit [Blastocatellia bacterium]|nr:phage terminase large subunit [Blastocatellia bacterium]
MPNSKLNDYVYTDEFRLLWINRILEERRGQNPTSRPRNPNDIPFCPHIPTPKQREFLALTCREALFGGAAGGGKSDCLLMAALQYVHEPGYAALMLRRTYADLSLPGALMDRAADWLRPTAAKWRETDKTWLFPSGATLTFGYLETEASKYRYQGAELQAVFFDELSQFPEGAYRYLFSRLRRLQGAEVPIRMRSATNPGSEWVKQRFLVEGAAAGRVFVPSRISDNPYLDAEEYKRTLDELDPVTRQQLLEGDWDVRAEGALFKRHWFEIVDAAPALGPRVRFWDMASTKDGGDWSVGLKMVRSGGIFTIEDVQRGRWTPHERDAVILQTAKLDGHAVKVVVEQEPGSAGVSVVAAMVQMLAGYPVEGRRATGDKVTRAAPLASQAQAGNVKLVAGGWNSAFIDELSAFPSVGIHDDQCDSASGAFGVLTEESENPLSGSFLVGSARGW